MGIIIRERSAKAWQSVLMRINDPTMREEVARIASDPDARRILSATVKKAMSAIGLSSELSMPVRSLYRTIERLRELGLLAIERTVLIDSGGKYALYRSMVKAITVKYEAEIVEVDLIPNEDILARFLRFWNYMGRA